MKHAPRLEFELRPSRVACAAITLGAAATAALVFALRMPWWVTAIALVTTTSVAAYEVRRSAGRHVPALVVVGDNRRLTVCNRDGPSLEGEILDASYVGASLTTIVWRADGAPWWRPAQSLLILPDMLPAEDFRRLRVLLRYGIPDARAKRSGVEAG